MKRAILCVIKIYQKTLSPDHGFGRFFSPTAGCRFYPSCSQYAHDAVSRYGIFKGIFLGAKRILKCHPWAKGGFDPVK
jgi:uncharacterized protein